MPTNRLVVKAEVATYASVLLDSVNEAGGQNAVLEVLEQMKTIVYSLRTNANLVEALNGTAYTPEQRSELAKNIFADCHPLLVEVLALMAERGEVDLLSRVLTGFGEQIESKLGVAIVEVTTAVELDDNLRDVITKKLEADLGKSVVLKETVDKSILGGIIMSTNGKHLDASMTSQLDRAREVLKSSN